MPTVLPLTAAPAIAAERAAVAAARFDERLTRSDEALAEGALVRAHTFDAQALVSLAGGAAALEDIVLNDAGMDARAPTTDVVRGASLLALRRSLARRDAADVLAPAAVRRLAGIAESEPEVPRPEPPRASREVWAMPLPASDEDEAFWSADDEDEGDEPLGEEDGRPPGDALRPRARRPLASFNDLAAPAGVVRVSDPAYGEGERIEAWLAAVAGTAAMPGAVAAAAALDAWLRIEPSERRGELGFLLAAALLRERLTLRHLPALALGYRRGRYRWGPHQDEGVRLEGLLGAIAEASALGQADLDRLTLAREVMRRRCLGRSRNSRLADLVGLFVASPLVSVPLAAKRLGVSSQAVEAMLKELGSALPRELTGRRRYRAWGVL